LGIRLCQCRAGANQHDEGDCPNILHQINPPDGIFKLNQGFSPFVFLLHGLVDCLPVHGCQKLK